MAKGWPWLGSKINLPALGKKFMLFTSPRPYWGWEPIAVGDFNGDGISDIAWKHTVSGNVYIQLFTAGRVLGGTGILGNAIDKDFMCVGDFDANTRHELVFAPKLKDTISVIPVMWFPDATGLALTTTTDISLPFSWNYIVQLKQCKDNDGDGKAEIIFKNAYGGSTPPPGYQAEDFIWCMNGAIVKANAPGSSGALRGVANSWRHCVMGDFNTDGKFDLWWRRDGPPQFLNGLADGPTGENYIYPMTGNTIGGTEGYSRQVTDLNWKVIAAGQFDGLLGWDILFKNEYSGGTQMYIYAIDNTIAAPFITANEGNVLGAAAYSGFQCIGSGNFNAGAGPVIDLLMWNSTTRVAKIATISFAFVAPAGDNYTISAGVVVPYPPGT